MSRKLKIDHLILKEYRNYSDLDLILPGDIITITGPNGIGKTNIIEAMSLLVPGRGIRGAKITDLDNSNQDPQYKVNWQVKANIESKRGSKFIELSHSLPKENSERSEKIIKVDGEVLKSKSLIAELMSMVWLTPQMDFIFIGGASDRRKFIDKITADFHHTHATHLSQYEHYMRERLKLLKDGCNDRIWLDNIEQSMSQHASAITASRLDTISYLNITMNDITSQFLKANLMMCGFLEDIYQTNNAITTEQYYLEKLESSRALDGASGRTNFGPHLSDLAVLNRLNNTSAEHCSTGEQKSLLISIILAEIKAKEKWHNILPVILLDDIVSHLDVKRRQSLLEEILAQKAQTFITCANLDELEFLKSKSHNIMLDCVRDTA